MDFVINEEKDLKDEINKSIVRCRQQTEKLMKKIINTQVGFNECLSSSIVGVDLGNKNYKAKHYNLIEQTCKLDRGLESIMRCNTKDKLGINIEEDLKIENEDELKEYVKFKQYHF